MSVVVVMMFILLMMIDDNDNALCCPVLYLKYISFKLILVVHTLYYSFLF